MEDAVTSYLKVWLISCPFIILLHLVKTDKVYFLSIRDISLFLLTGGAIGTTIGNLIKSGNSSIENIWLVAAICVAIIHYSPSKRDKYLN